ncbi:Rrf2 family transcriptional regulator [Caldimonas thermodepolymerans]|jgi:Predicted transcriptional regulator|uniref:Rrf2 family transcriptional regulator n=1 Tax=Caldimonas thermodepolymerans TaxID=215580 RepID=UPI0024934B96|nr:Rrf2 family transcriptional regulator [Caldimonas thermodepolymerans]
MKKNSQLSDVLHVLLHMAQAEGPATSEALAAAMQTNPVVLRRLMAGLRDKGFVRSSKGHGGGWVLACSLDTVTLRSVYEALGDPPLISLGFREDQPRCLVAQAVNDALSVAMRDAERLLLQRLGDVTLAALASDFRRRMRAHRQAPHRLEDHIHAG